MDINPFFIRYCYNDRWADAKIRPALREDNTTDYAVWIKGKLEFIITRNSDTSVDDQWVLSVKNVGNKVDHELIQIVGAEIEYKQATSGGNTD